MKTKIISYISIIISIYIIYYVQKCIYLTEGQLMFKILYDVLQTVDEMGNIPNAPEMFFKLWEERLKQYGINNKFHLEVTLIREYLFQMKHYLIINENCNKNLLDLCDKILLKITLHTMLYNALYFILAILGIGSFVYLLNVL